MVPFTIDPARKTRLLNGWDELDLTAQHKDKIDAFAAKDRAERPWAVPRSVTDSSTERPASRSFVRDDGEAHFEIRSVASCCAIEENTLLSSLSLLHVVVHASVWWRSFAAASELPLMTRTV